MFMRYAISSFYSTQINLRHVFKMFAFGTNACSGSRTVADLGFRGRGIPSLPPSLSFPSPPLLSPPLLSHPSPSLPSLPLPLEVGPLFAARGSVGALKLPQRVRVEPGRQTHFGAF